MSKSTTVSSLAITQFFERLPDPRRLGKVKHPLINLIVMSLCGVIGGADDFHEISRFVRERSDWFSRILDMKHGVPSHDTFSRVFRALNPIAFQQCLLKWVTALHQLTDGQIIAIDGKVAREAFARSGDQGPLTLVSAWATANQVCLGQVAGEKGSNELAALPALLKLLELKGAIVTLDALGCQKNIVKQITDQGGDYVISVKDNQAALATTVQETIAEAFEMGTVIKEFASKSSGHGRDESRFCVVIEAPEFEGKEEWKGINTFAMVAREYQDSKGQHHSGVRYFVSSLPITKARKLFDAVRAHWTVENQLHWRLDVVFDEDKSRARLENAQANLGVLRRTALSMLKNTEELEGSIKGRRKSAGWNTDVLEIVLFNQELG